MRLLSLAAAIALAASISVSALAQGAAPGAGTGGSGKAAEQAAAEPAARSTRSKRSSREPTAGQMAARERQRKCGAEWRDAKTGGTTGGLKWPQFYSKCNARLKGNSA